MTPTVATFHRRCAKRITLTNGNRTAMRNVSEFNHGLVLSAEPLQDDILFEVQIDEKIQAWSGSIEIGVTTVNPESAELPPCATKLRNSTWVMSGISVLKDGLLLVESYGTDLEKLAEGDRVGVQRTSRGRLVFYVNGEPQGIAACDLPQAVPDSNDKLRSHTRCGSLVKLSANCRTTKWRKPLDEFNNGVVMTHRLLWDNELFEIRIDRLVDKWSGLIEVGVTTHYPSTLQFPATTTNLRSGTIMMSGCGILTNGKGTHREYGECNLDELREGDRVGMMRKANENLHYYINGRNIQPHATLNSCQCVIFCRDFEGITGESIQSELAQQKVKKVYRFHKRVNVALVPTHSFLLTIDAVRVPSSIDIGLYSVQTRTYYPKPMLCANCLSFGHTQKYCNSEKKCFNCSKAAHGDCSAAACCNHCKGNHKPNASICQAYIKENLIIKTKIDNKVHGGTQTQTPEKLHFKAFLR